MSELEWLEMEIRKKNMFFSPVRPQGLRLEFLLQPSSTTRHPVQRTAEQETGRNMEGVEEEEEEGAVYVSQEISESLVVGLKHSQKYTRLARCRALERAVAPLHQSSKQSDANTCIHSLTSYYPWFFQTISTTRSSPETTFDP
ncbi:unnamed protein product [Pleuronectes platessa]|uniref:Uncharacterized protein n=1 Tax=Pleuronectes platessa TaxID=8262 RepID=A0A9N7VDA6_PLEPL|nr:unnamed protein product [Pleuronectes platessa]